MRILLTGGRAPGTLELLRILAHGSAQVFLAESLPYSVTSFSRYLNRSYRVPPPRQQAEEYAYAILDIVRKEGIQLIIPTCEEMCKKTNGYLPGLADPACRNCIPAGASATSGSVSPRPKRWIGFKVDWVC